MTKPKVRISKAARDARTGLSRDEIRRDFHDNLFFIQGKFPEVATRNDWYLALAYTVRDRLMDRWVKSVHHYWEEKLRTVCYFSAEFLIGPQLGMGLLDLGIEGVVRDVLREQGLTLEALIEQEDEPGLQRRIRTSGRMFHGVSRDARRPCTRLWYPLRVRHLRSGDSGWVAGGSRRPLAPPRISLGDRTSRYRLRSEIRGPHGALLGCRGPLSRELDSFPGCTRHSF